jgi:hypothetical protein
MVPFWEYVTAGMGVGGGPSTGVAAMGVAGAYDTCKHNIEARVGANVG